MPCMLSFAKRAMEQSNAPSAFVMSVVGSLECVTLRMANTGKRNLNHNNKRPRSDDDEEKEEKNDCCGGGNEKMSSNEVRQWEERLEIVSLVGTFDKDGGQHLHMSVSDAKGNVFGGHLIGGTIFTTLELVVGVIAGVQFTRELCDNTGFQELVVNKSQR